MTRILVLTGPTGIGKSRLAMQLGQRANCSLISVDSVQVYRHMDIGTAKPTSADRARVPHYLVDIREPSQPYSAELFCRDAAASMATIHRSDRTPLFVGGTMMYLRSLLQGLSPLPSADARVRRQLLRRAQAEGWPALHAELRSHDPEAADRIAPGDAQRIQRALEVIALTGQRLSELRRRPGRSALAGAKVVALVPNDRAGLYDRLQQRVERMFQHGFVDEVRVLREHCPVELHLPAWRAVGYRQIQHGLVAGASEQQMREAVLVATRRLVRHQLTWIRHWPGAELGVVEVDTEPERRSQNEDKLLSRLLQLV